MNWWQKIVQAIKDWWSKNKPVTPMPTPPVPAPTPTPTPVPAPVSTSIWKGCMFFPYDVNNPPPWITSNNGGTDGSHGFPRHGVPWENDMRLNICAQTQKLGGDTIMYISESLRGNAELQMFITNRHSPVDGHQMNDSENSVVIARKYGITRWMICLFDSPDSAVPIGCRQAYIQEMCDAFSWATRDQVAFMVGLECNRNMDVPTVVQLVNWIKQYSGGKRIIVGSAVPSYLQQVASATKDVELWVETAFHPFLLTQGNADSYLNTLKDLKNTTGLPVLAGEFGNGKDPSIAYVSKQAIAFGMAGIGSYMKGQ